MTRVQYLTMFTQFFVLFSIIVFTNAMSIGNLSESRNVTKRDANNGDFYPEWVPFKNKHGAELGEFVDVKSKSKLKKRLALPNNFILKAVAEPQNDDYYEKAQGESDGEDYFEKKEWSDLNRNPQYVDHKSIHHTNISDIDGVVSIIKNIQPLPNSAPVHNKQGRKKNKQKKKKTKKEMKSLASLNNNNLNNNNSEETMKDESIKNDKDNTNENTEHEDSDSDKTQLHTGKDEYTDETKVKKAHPQGEEDETKRNDGEEEEEAKRIEDEKTKAEEEEKKAKALAEVDNLKLRHAEEQRIINEKTREEEEYESENLRFGTAHKHDDHPEHPKKISVDYDQSYSGESDENSKSSSYEDKYELRHRSTTTTQQPMRQKVQQQLNVFKNPDLFVIYDDQDIIPTTTTRPKKMTKSKKRRRPTTTSTTETYVEPSGEASSASREDNKETTILFKDETTDNSEPRLFFPKKKKTRKSRIKNKRIPNDSYVLETINSPNNILKVRGSKSTNNALDTSTNTKITNPSSSDTAESVLGFTTALSSSEKIKISVPTIKTTSDEITAPSSIDKGITAHSGRESLPSTIATSSELYTTSSDGDVASTVSKVVADAVPASTDHHKEHKQEQKKENHEHEKGGGRQSHSEYEEEHSEEGKKAYEGVHKDTKTRKGHHDEEDHLGKYDDSDGVDKHHHDEQEHYGAHHHEEHGKKHAKYEESGKHAKGHSTKGSHDIHKKDEYEKKVEFFEEEGDSAEDEKYGGFHDEKEYKAGGHFKKNNLNAAHAQHHKGESGHFGKGGHTNIHKGHAASGGHDGHGKRSHDAHHRSGHKSGKQWVYHHGSPAKTANLIRIDRRRDNLYLPLIR